MLHRRDKLGCTRIKNSGYHRNQEPRIQVSEFTGIKKLRIAPRSRTMNPGVKVCQAQGLRIPLHPKTKDPGVGVYQNQGLRIPPRPIIKNPVVRVHQKQGLKIPPRTNYLGIRVHQSQELRIHKTKHQVSRCLLSGPWFPVTRN